MSGIIMQIAAVRASISDLEREVNRSNLPIPISNELDQRIRLLKDAVQTLESLQACKAFLKVLVSE